MSVSSSSVGGKTKFKVVLLGDQQVGKTSIIERFINDRFEHSYNATIGIDFLVKNLTLRNRHYRIQLWDTAGQERFKSLIPSYLKDSNLCLLVYDMASPDSLQHCASWLELYNMHREESAFSVLVGNKRDLHPSHPTTHQERLQEFPNLRHFAISAKTGEGVAELFEQAILMVEERLSNVRIMDQIEEREDEKSQEPHTTKPVIEPSKSTKPTKLDHKKDGKEGEGKEEGGRKCC